MISSIQSGISKAIRVSGQALDKLGKSYELHSHTEKCRFELTVVFVIILAIIIFYLTFYFSASMYQSGQTWQERSKN